MRGIFAYPGKIDRVSKKYREEELRQTRQQPRSSQSPQCSGWRKVAFLFCVSVRENESATQSECGEIISE